MWLPIAVAGLRGRGRFVLFGGPHAFEMGSYGLLAAHDNARFLQNVLRWLLSDAPPNLIPEAVTHHALGTFFFNAGLDVVWVDDPHGGHNRSLTSNKSCARPACSKRSTAPRWIP